MSKECAIKGTFNPPVCKYLKAEYRHSVSEATVLIRKVTSLCPFEKSQLFEEKTLGKFIVVWNCLISVIIQGRYRWPCCLRSRSAVAWLLGSWVWIVLMAYTSMFVSHVDLFCDNSGLCEELIVAGCVKYKIDWRPGYRSRYCYLLQAGRSGNRILVGRDFPCPPYRPWGSPSHPCRACWGDLR